MKFYSGPEFDLTMPFFLLKAEQMMCESMEVRGQTEARKKIIREELKLFLISKKKQQ